MDVVELIGDEGNATEDGKTRMLAADENIPVMVWIEFIIAVFE